MTVLLLLCRGSDRHNFIAARIQGGGNTLDISSLSCRVPSLISYDHGNPVQIKPVVVFFQPLLFSFEQDSVFVLLQGFIHVHILQKRHADKVVLARINHRGQAGCAAVTLLLELQGFRDFINHDLENLQNRGFFVGPGDYMPLGVRPVCGFQHGIKGLVIGLVFMQHTAVLLGHPPLCTLLSRQLFLTLAHLFFGNMQEELDDHIAVVHQPLFEAVDLIYMTQVGDLIDLILHPHHGDLLIPGLVHDRPLARSGDCLPVSPHHGLALILFRRRQHIHNRKPSRIKIQYQLLDHRALPCPAPAFKKDDYRELFFFDRRVQSCQLLLQSPDLRTILLL